MRRSLREAPPPVKPGPARSRVHEWLIRRIADFLSRPTGRYELRVANDLERLKQVMRKGDVILVEGDQRVSAVIKYLTQSSWSHAALYIGDEFLRRGDAECERAQEAFGDEAGHLVVEALFEGVVLSPLSKYVAYNLRVCRPHGLRVEDCKVILDEALAAVGWRYDLRNILDLAAHLVLATLFPGRYRARARRLGSNAAGEVICTSLLGRLFYRVRFPVLPLVTFPEGAETARRARRPAGQRWLRRAREPYRARFSNRHPTLLTPRDFDTSPYFDIVKLSAVDDAPFDYQRIVWEDDPGAEEEG
jgi:hypothetical protein